MHRVAIVVFALAVTLTPAVVGAQDTEALRRELEQLRRQQQEYQKAIEALSQRLQKLESQPAPTTAQPAMLPFAVVASVAPTASDPVDSASRSAADSRAPPRA